VGIVPFLHPRICIVKKTKAFVRKAIENQADNPGTKEKHFQ
jgi:hypothetical protein